jgi:hypothetical protein
LGVAEEKKKSKPRVRVLREAAGSQEVDGAGLKEKGRVSEEKPSN